MSEEKKQLELIVAEGFEAQLPKEIPCNIEEIIRALDEEVLPKYLTRIYTDDQLAEARADHATLKKWVDAVDGGRKQYEKIYMKPFKEFKDKLKLATDRVQEAIEKINEQITAIEGKTKSRNEDFCREYFESTVDDLTGLVSFEQIADPKWFNLSVKDTERKKAIDEKLAKIRGDLAVINQLSTPDIDLVKVFYIRNFDLPAATTFVNGIRNDKARILANWQANHHAETKSEAARENHHAEAKTAHNANDEVTFTIRFEVNGTKEDFEKLKSFLDKNNIEYKAID